jgi:hypothetical protein
MHFRNKDWVKPIYSLAASVGMRFAEFDGGGFLLNTTTGDYGERLMNAARDRV